MRAFAGRRDGFFVDVGAGNTVPVLLQTYARCIYGQEGEITARIINALGDDPGLL